MSVVDWNCANPMNWPLQLAQMEWQKPCQRFPLAGFVEFLRGQETLRRIRACTPVREFFRIDLESSLPN